jgi:hypothetical protein
MMEILSSEYSTLSIYNLLAAITKGSERQETLLKIVATTVNG